MSDLPEPPTPRLNPRLAAVLELGDALRGVLRSVSATEVDASTLEEAAALARRVDALLEQSLRAPSVLPSVDDLARGQRHFNPVSGAGNPMSIPLVFHDTLDGIVCRASFDRRFEGPPGHLHGGIIALVFDEVLGQANMNGGGWGMTASLQTTYRRAVPLDVEIEMRARVVGIDGRKTTVEAWMTPTSEPDGRYAEAKGLFIEPRPETKAGYFSSLTDTSGKQVEALLARPDRPREF